MRKFKLVFLFFTMLFAFGNKVDASHYMGGEITWECIPTGQPNAGKYIFIMKAFRECAGITFGTSETILSNSPAGSIPVTLQAGYPKDRSPQCNTNYLNITCATTTVPNTGGVSEYLFKSNPITLNGVPPASGWVFYWTGCCRNPCTNIPGTNSMDWYLKATMFPYNGANANPCFDNSPAFAEHPRTVITGGYPFTYNHNAYDKELDSLVYSWGQPLIAGGAPIVSYNAGYSYTSPLPGVMQNPLNVPAQINAQTGEISYTSHTTGAFVTSIRVNAYKCGIKVAEIMRDIQVVILPGVANTPPTVTAPFANPTTGLFTEYIDTVYAGDLVCFNMSATDFEFLPNGNPQTMTISSSGIQFGSYIPASGGNPSTFSTTTGCLNPPCATLTPAPSLTNPLAATFGVQTQFCWQTDCGHLNSVLACGVTSNVYNFVIRVSDDYCPAPALNVSTITVVVQPKPILKSPPIQCVEVLPNGDVKLKWSPVIDTMATFHSYHLYSYTNNNPPVLVDSIMNINTTTYTHVGANANQSAVNYFLKVKSGCPGLQSQTAPFDTVSTIFLSVVNPLNGTALLNWNPIRDSLLTSSDTMYNVYREYPVGTWVYLGATPNLTYSDMVTVCGDTLKYYVTIADFHLVDGNGNIDTCESVSSVAGDYFEDAIAPNIPVIDSVSVNPLTGSVHIGWDVNPMNDTYGYIVYYQDNGNWIAVDTVFGQFNTYFQDILNQACLGQRNYYKVAAIDSCGQTSPMSIEHHTMRLKTDMYICGDSLLVTWDSYDNFPTGLGGYNLFVSENGGPIQLLGTTLPGDTNFVQIGLNDSSTYCYGVQAFDVSGNRTSSSCALCEVANKPNQPQFLYIRTAGVAPTNNANVVVIHTDTTAKVMHYKLERSMDNVTWNLLATIPPSPLNPTITYIDGTAFVNQMKYYYRAIVTDSCGVDFVTSNVARTMFLNVEAQDDMTNELSWTSYSGFDADVAAYAIYRSVDGVFDPLAIAVVPASQNIHLDDVQQYATTGGVFRYYIHAVEDMGNIYGFQDTSRSNEVLALQKPRVYIPNAFMPGSGNTLNQTFYPKGIFINSPDYLFQVYNRWGELVFETTSVNTGWDGKVNGDDAPEGVYSYYVRFTISNGDLFEKRGTVTLLR